MRKTQFLFSALITGILLFAASLALGQSQTKAEGGDSNVSYKVRLEPSDLRPGEAGRIVLEFQVKEGWHLYAPSRQGDFVELGLSLREDVPGLKPAAKLIEPPLPVKIDKGFQVEVAYVEGGAAFSLPFTTTPDFKPAGTLPLLVEWQACDDTNCDRPKADEVDLSYQLATGEPRSDKLALDTSPPDQPEGYKAPEGDSTAQSPTKTDQPTDEVGQQISQAKQSGLLSFMLLAFVLGLGALATPCVWPMIPITVSYFSKKKDGQKSNLPGALAFGIGIMVTFTGIGLLATLLLGAGGVGQVAANPFINGFLAILFVVLALNLFGVFEIVVPAGVVNSLQQKGGKAGGFVGPVLMGLAFSLTSFTCTVPFAGTVLASAASGDYFYPAVGMMSFSLAFAVPFFLLAMFPQWLASLPKSGTWLISVKAYMGFLELAFALKFLSNIELVYQVGILTRPVFLAIWAAIITLAAVYLMGWVKLPHEDETTVGWGRRVIGLLNFGIVLYLLGGVQGAPVKEIVAFLPPEPYPGRESTSGVKEAVSFIENLDEGVEQAKAEDKLIFVDFTGVTCTNCRWMEKNMFPSPKVKEQLEKMVRVKLWTDRQKEEDRKNAALQLELTKVSTLPVYVVMNQDRKVLRIFQGFTQDEAQYLAFLTGESK